MDFVIAKRMRQTKNSKQDKNKNTGWQRTKFFNYDVDPRSYLLRSMLSPVFDWSFTLSKSHSRSQIRFDNKVIA